MNEQSDPQDSWIVDLNSCRATKRTSDGRAIIEVVWYDLPGDPGFALSSYSGANLSFETSKDLLTEAKCEIAEVRDRIRETSGAHSAA